MGEFDDRKTWALTSDGDIKESELNRFEWVYGQDAVIQGIKTTLATIEGEDPFDEEHGLNVFLATGNSVSELKLQVAEAIMDTHDDDVKKINSIAVEGDGARGATVEITLTLIDGSEHDLKVND